MGRLTDRLGQSRVLLPMVAVHAAGVLTLLVLVENGAPAWTLFVAAVPTGVCCPPLGSQVRARWSALLGNVRSLDTAYVLESVLVVLVIVLVACVVTSYNLCSDTA